MTPVITLRLQFDGLRYVLESVLQSVKVLESHVLPEIMEPPPRTEAAQSDLSVTRFKHKETVWGIAHAVQAAAEARRVEAELLREAEEAWSSHCLYYTLLCPNLVLLCGDLLVPCPLLCRRAWRLTATASQLAVAAGDEEATAALEALTHHPRTCDNTSEGRQQASSVCLTWHC